MNEQFFIVTEESPLYKDYFDWKANNKEATKIACDFAKRHNLPALIAYTNSQFSIIANKEELNLFKNQLKKYGTWTEHGVLYDFKKNSPIGKAWKAELNDKNFKILNRPLAMLYFSDSCGRWGWQFLEYDNKLYLKISTEREQNTPKGMKEIKGSEFYSALENYESKMKELHESK